MHREEKDQRKEEEEEERQSRNAPSYRQEVAYEEGELAAAALSEGDSFAAACGYD